MTELGRTRQTLVVLILVLFWEPSSGADRILRFTSLTASERDRIPTITLPTFDRDALLRDDEATGDKNRFAIATPLSVTPESAGRWLVEPNGTRVWHLRVVAPAATNLSLKFNKFRLPPDAALYVFAPDAETVRGPYTDRDERSHGMLWTPIVQGNETILEVRLPPGGGSSGLVLEEVFQGYRPEAPEELSCHVHIACPEGKTWREEARAAVRFTVDRGTALEYCSGTIVADVPASERPFLLTAYHCGVTDTNAASMIIYWDDESPTCNPSSVSTGNIITLGATWRAAWQCTDFTLVELDSLPSSQTDVYFAGWDRLGAVPSGAVSIHHPGGTQKRFSSLDQALAQGQPPAPQFAGCPALTHWGVAWESGTTEAGSSGAAAWDPNHHIVGVLSTASPDCSNPILNTAAFGKFSMSWDTSAWPGIHSGGLPETQLRNWLDPNNTGSSRVDGRNAVAYPAYCTAATEVDLSPSRLTSLAFASKANPARALTRSGTGFGLVWWDSRDGNPEIYFRTLDVAGHTSSPEYRVTTASGESSFPSIAWNGVNYGIVWNDMRYGNWEVMFALVSPAGSVLTERRLTNEPNYSLYPKVAWNGSSFGVVWNDFRNANYEIYYQKVAADGTPDPAGNKRLTTNAGTSVFPELKVNDTDYAVAWYDNTPGNFEIYFRRFDMNGNATTPERRVTSAAGSSEYPSLAWNGGGYGLAWHDQRSGSWEIWFATLDASGNVSAGPFDISNNAGLGDALWPSLEWKSGEYGLAWQDSRYGNLEIRVARLSPSGHQTVSQRRVSQTSSASTDCTVGWAGQDFVVVWNDATDGQNEVYAARLGCCPDADRDAINACSFDALENPTGGDCGDSNSTIHPDAMEINDGLDNQCSGDGGFGQVDEVSGVSGFKDPSDRNAYCWPQQAGATGYEAVRSESPSFDSGCAGTTTTATCWSPPGDPGAGQTYYFLVRAVSPHVGSWGADSTGEERTSVCP
jgi:hypothetical protein